MSTKKRILANALLTAGVLTLVGFMYAQLAGMWMSTQQVQRTVLAEAPTVNLANTADQVSDALMWRLPFTLAAMGFLFVLAGESLLNLWRQPSSTALTTIPRSVLDAHGSESIEAARIAANKESEAMMQQLLKDAERDPLLTPPPRGALKLDLSKIQSMEHVH